jgi:Delta7-sterol 5-desaturase
MFFLFFALVNSYLLSSFFIMSTGFEEQFTTNIIILTIRYFLFCGLAFAVLYILLKRPLAKYKLQPAFPQRTEHLRDIIYSVISVLIFSFVFTFTVTVLLPYTRIYQDMETFGNAYYLFSYILMILLHDTYFYWSHRLIHSRLLFSTVHSVHHRSSNPSPWTSYAFHPMEALIQSFIIPLIALIFPVHISAIILYFLFQFVHNIYGHLGFEILPAFIRKNIAGKQLNTSVLHNAHHRQVRGNYGLYFTWWDRLMGTLRE